MAQRVMTANVLRQSFLRNLEICKAVSRTPERSGPWQHSSVVLARTFWTSSVATSQTPKPLFNTPSPAPGGSTNAAPSVTPEASKSGLADASYMHASSPGGGNGQKPKKGFFRKLRTIFGYTSVAALATVGYFVYDANHPPEQLPPDPSKKTIVILGSGWGSTALLDAIDTTDYNVVVISPYNYFLFTPLLPSVTVGTLNGRSITQPTRHLVRYKSREVQVVEAEATKVDVANKKVTFEDKSEIYGNLGTVEIPYDYLVYAVGSENQTFGIEGVKKYGNFLKELGDAEAVRRKLMDCVEKASLLGQSEEEIDRLLHFVVVGGGPTGVEASGEFRDFVRDDLSKWYPAVSGRVKVSLIEAMPTILPMFSEKLAKVTEGVFQDNEIQILTQHMVKEVEEASITVKNDKGEIVKIPFGMLVWAAGNTARPLTRDIQAQIKDRQTNRRGLLVDGYMRLVGAEDSVFVIGDAAATACPPTAQAANQQGRYLATVFAQLARLDSVKQTLECDAAMSHESANRLEKRLERLQAKVLPFEYTSRGAMAYIGHEQAIIQLPFGEMELTSAGVLTGLAWSSAYWSLLFGIRSRTSVALDWLKVRVFGRDLSV